MQHITQWSDLYHLRNTKTTLMIGNFDGLHLGHQALVDKARELSRADQSALALMNFNPHPSALFSDKPLERLTDDQEMFELLEAAGINYWFQMPFNLRIANLEPHEFIESLTNNLSIQHIVVGFNFKFGKAASGHGDTLHELGARFGFESHIVAPVYSDDFNEAISSTKIRKYLNNGQIALANKTLGRCYTVSGKVVSGFQRGMEIGFPTANLLLPQGKLLPSAGVYAGVVGEYNAAINIGNNPTFGNLNQTIEVHLIGFSGDLYGQSITVQFVQKLRDEHKFKAVEDLVCQLKQDIAQISALNPVQIFTN